MAEIRCPMCGKPNPDNLEICQFCEARIKPLRASDSSQDTPSQENRHLGLPDWLLDDGPVEQESEDLSTPEESEEWLDRLRVQSEDSVSPEEPKDWLDGLRVESEESLLSQPETEQPDDDADSSMEGSDDWLQRIRTLHKEDQDSDLTGLEPPLEIAGEPETPPEESQEEEEPEGEDRDIVDWLSRLDADEPAERMDEVYEESTPDWLKERFDTQTSISEPPEPESMISEEVSGFTEQAGQEVPESIPAFPETEERIIDEGGDEYDDLETSDWLSRLDSEEPEEAEGEGVEGTIPDWLKESFDTQTSISEPPEPESMISEEVSGFTELAGQEVPESAPAFQETEERIIDEGGEEYDDLETSDWLSRLDSEEPEEAEGEGVEGTMPDWLKESLDSQSQIGEPLETTIVSGDDASDFPDQIIQDFPESGVAPQEFEETDLDEEEPIADDQEGLEWLNRLDSVRTEAAEVDAEEEPMPDWLKESLGFQSSADEVREADSVVGDEISGIPTQEPEKSISGEEEIAVDDQETLAWLDRLGGKGDEEIKEPIPDWLREDIETQRDISRPPETDSIVIDEDEPLDQDLPTEDIEVSPLDILEAPSYADTTEEPEESLSDEDVFEADETETAGWLDRLADSGTEAVADEIAEEPIPDWLAGSLDETQEPEAAIVDGDREVTLLEDQGINETILAPQEPETEVLDKELEKGIIDDLELPLDDEAIPDWLSDQKEEVLQPVPSEQTPVGETPDWLTGLGEVDDGIAVDIPADGIVDVLQGKEPISSEEEYLQQWFTDLDKDDGAPLEPHAEAEVTDDEHVPGWLKSLGSVVTGTIGEETPDIDEGPISPFIPQEEFGDDLLDVEKLPEWLTPDSAQPEAAEERPESDLTPADVPGWLAAIRPADRAAPDDGEPIPKGAGPLAGLSNILPAEPAVVHFDTPLPYSGKFQITSTQQAHAEIFRELISLEGKAEKIPEPPLISSQRALRWLIAFVLTLAIGFVLVSNNTFAPFPNNTNIPDSTYASSRLINNLQNQSPVLIAFDYDPGTTGEMHAATAALVNHLMLKDARLVLVSTLPTGPAVAEYFVETTQKQFGYPDRDHYINLGYIPGGPIGLQSFAQTPKFVFPRSFDGLNPWENEFLLNVSGLSDFALLIIITNDPNTARSWIEQVKPQIQNTPLLAVVSAQAEPMIRPYYGNDSTSQVQGIISGLPGGAAYEFAIGKDNLGRVYWDGFSVGLIIAVAAILIGGIINVVQFFRTQDKTLGQKGAR